MRTRLRFVVLVAVCTSVAVVAPGAIFAGPLDQAACALKLGKPGVNGAPMERGKAHAATAKLQTLTAAEARRRSKQLNARMTKGVTIELDRSGMSGMARFAGDAWKDEKLIEQFVQEHPCLFGVTAGTRISMDDVENVTSSTGHWGTIKLDYDGQAHATTVYGHLWPFPPPRTLELDTWNARYPDVETHPVRPMCDPVVGGPPDQCRHQHDPVVVKRVHAIRNVRCAGSVLVPEDLVSVSEAPTDGSTAREGAGAASDGDVLYDPVSGARRGAPSFVLEWHPPSSRTGGSDSIVGAMKCLD